MLSENLEKEKDGLVPSACIRTLLIERIESRNTRSKRQGYLNWTLSAAFASRAAQFHRSKSSQPLSCSAQLVFRRLRIAQIWLLKLDLELRQSGRDISAFSQLAGAAGFCWNIKCLSFTLSLRLSRLFGLRLFYRYDIMRVVPDRVSVSAKDVGDLLYQRKLWGCLY